MRQLQIEFPDSFMKKYWLDNNDDITKAESDHCIIGMYNSFYKRKGWHYTRKHDGPEQFPIEKHWVWYEPPTVTDDSYELWRDD